MNTETNVRDDKSEQTDIERTPDKDPFDAPSVPVDIYKCIDHLCYEKAWREADRNVMTIYKSPAMRIVLVGLHEGATIKTHQADTTISVQLMEGKVRFITKDSRVDLNKGQIISLREHIPHSIAALKESFILLTLTCQPSN